MNDNLITTIITEIVTIVATWITSYYASIFPKKKEIEKLKKKLTDKDKQMELHHIERIDTLSNTNEIVSTGVAIGYYRNFIKRIFNKLDEGNRIEVKLYLKGETEEQVLQDTNRTTYFFNEEQVNITVLLPKDLTTPRLYDAEECEKEKTKALLIGKNKERHFSFFCEIVNNERLEIYDYPNPFDAVRWFISLDDRYGIKKEGAILKNMETNSKQSERHEVEIINFKSTVEHLTQIDLNKSIINKIKFYQLK